MRVRLSAAAAATLGWLHHPSLSEPSAPSSRRPPKICATGGGSPRPPSIVGTDGQPLDLRLIQVQLAFRHGARTPVEDAGARADGCRWLARDTDKTELLQRCGRVTLYPPGSSEGLDPAVVFREFEPTPWNPVRELPGGAVPGRLTDVGLAQAVALGADLRERYVDSTANSTLGTATSKLLPREWSLAKHLVETRSTCVERTVYSAQGVLAGLFPSAAADSTLDARIELNGTHHDEFMVYSDTNCARLSQLFEQGLHLGAIYRDEAQTRIARHVESGMDGAWKSDSEPWKLVAFRDWYACRRASSKLVPPHVEEVAAELDSAAARNMHAIFEGGAPHTRQAESTREEALRLGIGRMLNLIVERLERPDGRLYLYSGHDWTCTPLLMAVARRDEPLLDEWPPFCSSIAFELWSSRPDDEALPHWASKGMPSAADDGRYVRVVWNGQPISLRNAEQGQEVVSLADFRRLVEPYRVIDFERECRPAAPPRPHETEDHHRPIGLGDEDDDVPAPPPAVAMPAYNK